MKDFSRQPHFKQVFIFGILVYGVALFALIRGDVYYIDDWGYSINGGNWNHFSRYVATKLSHIVNLKPIAIDVSPLTQIFAVMFLVFGGMIISFLIRKKIDYIGMLAAIPLGLSPYFLENLSYKFDSVFMGFSVLCCILPFLLKDRTLIFFISSVVCLILMYCSYQASNGIYMILGIYLTLSVYFVEGASLKRALGFLFVCILAFLIASLVYKVFLVKPVETYVLDSMFPLSQLLIGGANLKRYLTLVYEDSRTPYFYLVLVTMMCFVLHFVRVSIRSKLFAFVSSALFIVLGLCISYGLYLVLQKPLFTPRAFIGIGGFVAVLCVASIDDTRSSKIFRILPRILIVLIAYSLVVFATAYGNAVTKQQEYIYFRTDVLVRDLENIISKDEQSAVEFQGNIGYARATKPFVYYYQNIGRRLIPVLMSGGWGFTYQPLLNHRKAPYGGYGSSECQNKPAQSTLLLSNHYQDIYKAGSCYIVNLKDPKP